MKTINFQRIKDGIYEFSFQDVHGWIYPDKKEILISFSLFDNDRHCKRELLALIKELGLYNKENNYRAMSGTEMVKQMVKSFHVLENRCKQYMEVDVLI